MKYGEELIGPDTVNTLPLATIAAFQDHGHVARTIDAHLDDAYRTISGLEDSGIRMQDVTDRRLLGGVQLFSDSIERITRAIGEKGETSQAEHPEQPARGSARV